MQMTSSAFKNNTVMGKLMSSQPIQIEEKVIPIKPSLLTKDVLKDHMERLRDMKSKRIFEQNQRAKFIMQNKRHHIGPEF